MIDPWSIYDVIKNRIPVVFLESADFDVQKVKDIISKGNIAVGILYRVNPEIGYSNAISNGHYTAIERTFVIPLSTMSDKLKKQVIDYYVYSPGSKFAGQIPHFLPVFTIQKRKVFHYQPFYAENVLDEMTVQGHLEKFFSKGR